MQRLLLERPSSAIVVLVVLGLLGWALLRSTRPRTAPALLVGGILAAAVVGILARVVVTDRERVESASARLVEAVRAVDLATIDALLADDARFDADAMREGVGVIYPARLDKPEILAQVREHLGGDARVSHARVKESKARIVGPGIAQIDLRVQILFQNYGPYESWWRLDWRRTDAGVWRCWVIEPRGRE